MWQSLLAWVERGNGLRQSGRQGSSTWAYYHNEYQHLVSHRYRWGFVVKKLVIMEEDQRKTIEEIMGRLHVHCPRDFQCCMSRFEDICKATRIGLETVLECLEEGPQTCPLSAPFPFKDTHLCQCPLRVYIAKKLKK